MTTYQLQIDILDLWQAGSGKGQGSYLDSTPTLDDDGLPFLPGRHLRGLLREAVRHLALLGICGSGVEEALFGSHAGQEDRHQTNKGRLRVGSAHLPPEIRGHLLGAMGAKQLHAGLFLDVFQTAIDETTGAAGGRSLRSARLCVPMLLVAAIEELKPIDQDARAALEASLSLIDAVGAARNRGLGRCVATIKQAQEEVAHG